MTKYSSNIAESKEVIKKHQRLIDDLNRQYDVLEAVWKARHLND